MMTKILLHINLDNLKDILQNKSYEILTSGYGVILHSLVSRMAGGSGSDVPVRVPDTVAGFTAEFAVPILKEWFIKNDIPPDQVKIR